jgi:hypothetical protein
VAAQLPFQHTAQLAFTWCPGSIYIRAMTLSAVMCFSPPPGPGQVLADQRVHAGGDAGAVAACRQGASGAQQAAAAASTARTRRKLRSCNNCGMSGTAVIWQLGSQEVQGWRDHGATSFCR